MTRLEELTNYLIKRSLRNNELKDNDSTIVLNAEQLHAVAAYAGLEASELMQGSWVIYAQGEYLAEADEDCSNEIEALAYTISAATEKNITIL